MVPDFVLLHLCSHPNSLTQPSPKLATIITKTACENQSQISPQTTQGRWRRLRRCVHRVLSVEIVHTHTHTHTYRTTNQENRPQVISRDIYMDNPDVRWADLIGLDEAKKVMREAVVYPIRYPQVRIVSWLSCDLDTGISVLICLALPCGSCFAGSSRHGKAC
jgi:hypothetical protein